MGVIHTQDIVKVCKFKDRFSKCVKYLESISNQFVTDFKNEPFQVLIYEYIM